MVWLKSWKSKLKTPVLQCSAKMSATIFLKVTYFTIQELQLSFGLGHLLWNNVHLLQQIWVQCIKIVSTALSDSPMPLSRNAGKMGSLYLVCSRSFGLVCLAVHRIQTFCPAAGLFLYSKSLWQVWGRTHPVNCSQHKVGSLQRRNYELHCSCRYTPLTLSVTPLWEFSNIIVQSFNCFENYKLKVCKG